MTKKTIISLLMILSLATTLLPSAVFASSYTKSDGTVVFENAVEMDGNAQFDGSLTFTNGASNGFVLQTDGSGNATWVAPSGLSGVGGGFTTSGGLTSSDTVTDDFVFGSTQLNDTGNTDHDYRVFFDKNGRFGSFRAGHVTGTEWDLNNRGLYSVAFGSGTTASGSGSFAGGNNAISSATDSFSFGSNTEATQLGAVAFGISTDATGQGSFAAGTSAVASNTDAIALGNYANATGAASFAAGGTGTQGPTASGIASVAFGRFVTAGPAATTYAFGDSVTNNIASSFAVGFGVATPTVHITGSQNGTTAPFLVKIEAPTWANLANSEATDINIDLARNIQYSGGGSTIANHRVARIQPPTLIASSAQTITDASTVYIDGPPVAGTNITITNTPLSLNVASGAVNFGGDVTIGGTLTGGGIVSGSGIWNISSNLISNQGTNADVTADDFLIGSTQLADTGNGDHDNRFFFDKSKGATRGGTVFGTQWNDSNIGNFSTAFGHDVTASGENSIALGFGSAASNSSAIAIGESATASSVGSISIGDSSISQGVDSVAIGQGPNSSGTRTIAIGASAQASNTDSTALGPNALSASQNAVAIGHFTRAEGGLAAMAFGSSVTASAASAIVIGSGVSGNVINNSTAKSLEIGFVPSNTNPEPGPSISIKGEDVDDQIVITGRRHDGNNSLGMANSEITDLNVDLDRTGIGDGEVLFVGGSATIADQRAVRIQEPTYDAVSSGLTLTTAATLSIDDAPQAGSANVSITNAYALDVVAGATHFGGNVTVDGTFSASGVETDDIWGLNSGVVSNVDANEDSDDFVFGSDTLDDAGDAAHDNRFLFDKSTGAFRAGIATLGAFDSGNRGSGSSAFGLNPIAVGANSFVAGDGAQAGASGTTAISLGRNTNANASEAVAIGEGNIASGDNSMALGNSVTASSPDSIALGKWLTSSADSAITIGNGTGAGTRITNSTTDSLAVGFNSTSPTVLFRGAVDNEATANQITITGQAHNAISNADQPDINIDLATNNFNLDGNEAAIPLMRSIRVQPRTYTAVVAQTITEASTVYIDGPPAAGTNITITTPYALNVASGNVNFAGDLTVGGTITGTGVGGDFDNNGDTAGFNRDIGNNDAFALNIETNNVDRISIASDGEVIINEEGEAEADFRVESDTNANMINVDSGQNNIAIGQVPTGVGAILQVNGAVQVSTSSITCSGGANAGAVRFNTTLQQMEYCNSEEWVDFRTNKEAHYRGLFLTSTTHDGDFGGRAGMDAFCQSHAQTAGLFGRYVALASTAETAVNEIISRYENIKRVATDAVINDSNNLFSSGVESTVSIDENGNSQTTEPWTGSTSAGAYDASNNCNDWSSSSSGVNGAVGNDAGTTNWLDLSNVACNLERAVYCIQVEI